MPLNLDALIRLLVLVGLGMACALILQPFAEIVLWAGLLAVILKPLQLWLQRHLRLGRWWSAALIMLVGLLVLIGPVGALAAALLSNVSELVELVRQGKQALPQPPPLLLGIPVLGPAIKPLWHGLISDLHGLLRNHSDTLTTVMTRVLETTLAKGLGFLRLLVSLVVAAAMLVYSDELLLRLRRLLHRLAPEHAETVQLITATTVRNVSRGVVGVAFLQSLLIGLGLIAADVPWSGVLTLLALILCLMQIGPLPVVAVALVMAWSHLPPLMALLLTLWLLAATLLEHLLKPLLMARGLPVPMLVILVGVVGGTLKAGVAGLFLGPVVLSLGYHFVRLWVGTSAQPSPLKLMSYADRRQRIHELVVALIHQQSELDLLDGDHTGSLAAAQGNPAGWLERNRRVVQRYQALVRSAVTLDALVDQEVGERRQPASSDKLAAPSAAPWRASACLP